MQPLKEYLKTTPKYINLLAANGIVNMKDFFQYFPRAYEDRKNMVTFADVVSNEEMYSVKAISRTKTLIKTGRGRKIIEMKVEDINGAKASVNFFSSPFLLSSLKVNQRYVIVGKPKKEKNKITFRHPQLLPVEPPETSTEEGEIFNVGRLYPVYPQLAGISSARFAKKIRENKEHISSLFTEYLPAELLTAYELMDLPSMIHALHYPESDEERERAQHRLFFDKLLQIQISSLLTKQAYQGGEKYELTVAQRQTVTEIIERLPFSLTTAQKKVLKQIIDDIHLDRPMLRLLQGDVGSGKTIVAAIAAYYIMKEFGGQTVFLAPLEVLAQQHYRSLAALLLPLGVRIELVTGSVSKAQKDKIKQQLLQGQIDIVVGTHALLQDDVAFSKLMLAVIDEQHKFGVRQRAFFKQFGSPHILQMTATPIPRSMALAFFGEFDVSTIDEMPAGRRPITTKIITAADYTKIKPRILTKIGQGQRVFLIAPLIDESENLDLASAIQEFHGVEALYPELAGKIGLLHGKMKPKDKDAVMKQFKEGKIVFLVSTTVVEVGIDVPEASVMIIKNAERFGLAQLHQLRGRVGRSDIASYCFLETTSKSGDAFKRLRVLETTSDGFKLAEMDMQLRGTGEMLGVRQSGDTDIPVAIISDMEFLQKVQSAAYRLLDKHPNLEGLDDLKKFLDEGTGHIAA